MVASRTWTRGTDYMVSGDNILNLYQNPFTIACWLRCTSYTGSYQGVFGRWSSFQGNLLIWNALKYYQFYGVGNDVQSANDTSVLDEWQFVAVTSAGSNGTSGDINIWIGTTPSNLTSAASDNFAIGSAPTGNPGDSIIGLGTYWSSDSGTTFAGQMSHFTIYNRDLSLSELKEIMTKPYVVQKGISGFFPVAASAATKELQNGNSATETGTLASSTYGAPYFMDGGVPY